MIVCASHVQHHDDEVLAAVIAMAAPIGKAIDPVNAFWRQVKTAIPDFKLIARFSGWSWQPPRGYIQPETQAQEFILYCKNQPGWLLADYIETPNEPFGGGGDPAMYALYDRFMAECVILGHYAGKEVITGNFGTGNFTPEEWRQFFPRTLSIATHYGFHEYGWPRLWSQVDEADLGNGYALRCIAVMEEIRKTNPTAECFVTECGVTHIVVKDQPDEGYRTREGVLASPVEYWGDLIWYLWMLEKHPFIKSIHVFQTGANPDWSTFEVVGTPIIDRMREWNLKQEEEPVIALADQFSVLYERWVAEGGDPEGELRRHLLGIGVLAATQADLDKLINSVQAGVLQVANVAKLLQAPNP